MLAVAEVAAIGAVAEPTAAALSQFEDLGAAALSQCAAQAIGVGPIAATAAIAATVSVRPRWAPLRSEPLRPGPTAAAATTPTATTFAPAGIVRTERSDAVDLNNPRPFRWSGCICDRGAIDQHIADAGRAHFAERDLFFVVRQEAPELKSGTLYLRTIVPNLVLGFNWLGTSTTVPTLRPQSLHRLGPYFFDKRAVESLPGHGRGSDRLKARHVAHVGFGGVGFHRGTHCGMN
jgi:hypothetical protein